MHPFISDLSGLTLDELNKKLSDITKRMQFAYSIGQSDMINQLQLINASYQNEFMIRQNKMMEEMAEKSKQFKDIIDIK